MRQATLDLPHCQGVFRAKLEEIFQAVNLGDPGVDKLQESADDQDLLRLVDVVAIPDDKEDELLHRLRELRDKCTRLLECAPEAHHELIYQVLVALAHQICRFAPRAEAFVRTAPGGPEEAPEPVTENTVRTSSDEKGATRGSRLLLKTTQLQGVYFGVLFASHAVSLVTKWLGSRVETLYLIDPIRRVLKEVYAIIIARKGKVERQLNRLTHSLALAEKIYLERRQARSHQRAGFSSVAEHAIESFRDVFWESVLKRVLEDISQADFDKLGDVQVSIRRNVQAILAELDREREEDLDEAHAEAQTTLGLYMATLIRSKQHVATDGVVEAWQKVEPDLITDVRAASAEVGRYLERFYEKLPDSFLRIFQQHLGLSVFMVCSADKERVYRGLLLALDIVRSLVGLTFAETLQRLGGLPRSQRATLAERRKEASPGLYSDLTKVSAQMLSDPTENWRSYRVLFPLLMELLLAQQELVILRYLDLIEPLPEIRSEDPHKDGERK